jgi:hypothetical protein
MADILARAVRRTQMVDPLQLNQFQGMLNTPTSLPATTPFALPLDVLVAGAGPIPTTVGGYFARCFAPIFNFPNLRSIYGWNFGDTIRDVERHIPDVVFSRLRPRSCPVEYIECRRSSFAPLHLTRFLNATQPGRLKTFIYEVARFPGGIDMHSKSASIVRSLEPHHATLQCLGLSLENIFNWYDHKDPDPVSLGCFSALKQLKVSPAYIFGEHALQEPIPMCTEEMLWKTLPKSLEELWITGAAVPGMVNPAQDLSPTFCYRHSISSSKTTASIRR